MLRYQNVAQTIVRLGHSRVQLQNSSELGDGSVVLCFPFEREAEVVMGFREVTVERDRPAIFRNSGVEGSVRVLEGKPEVVMEFGLIGLQANRLAIGIDGPLAVA